MDLRAETAHVGPTSHTQMSSECDTQDSTIGLAPDQGFVRVPAQEGPCRTITNAYIGLDWGDQRHAVQMQPAAGGPVERLELDQRPDVLHAWVAQLRPRFHGRPIGIALEQRKGAVIHALMMYEFLVLYPVNPKAVARYREVFAPSGAKDDPTDAALLLDLLCTHRDKLRAWIPDTVAARTLGLLCEQRRKLVQHRAQRATSAGVSARQRSCLTEQLRCPCRLCRGSRGGSIWTVRSLALGFGG